ncbi:MAG: arsenate reductase ArsC [Hyphomonadaceae bacterium]|nr:arsenate reductase ArsC [Hyphomonadaceae bacterium]MBY0564851.1 arsenate reductase ArsC [Hyphomonadaceae bacterium]
MKDDFKGKGTPDKPFNVLFLCTGNSARSVIAEALMNRMGNGKFKAYSAGSMPKGEVHPQTLKLLDSMGYDTTQFSSKSWDVFAGADAVHFDFIITVCDNAANETCPVWPGKPVAAHWGLPDPAAVTGTDSEIALAFADTYRMMANRIKVLCALPIASLDRLAVKQEMDKIGRKPDAPNSGPTP